MTRKGNCRNNAPTGSVFGSIKNELDGEGPFDMRQATRTALSRAIEGWHNRRRLNSRIGYVTAASDEQLATTAQAVTRVHRHEGWSPPRQPFSRRCFPPAVSATRVPKTDTRRQTSQLPCIDAVQKL